jgi:hypothetical protein
MAVPHNLRVHADIAGCNDGWGICDRCGFLRMLTSDLPFQFDQRGNSVQNLGIRVCVDRCLDEIATILAPVIIVGPEGTGNPNPRPTKYAQNNAQGPSPQLPFTPGNPMAPVIVPEQPQKPNGEWTVQGQAAIQSYDFGYPGI